MDSEQSSRELIEKRKEKIIQFIKNPEFWIISLLVVALILGVYIRSMPLQDHNGLPGLWDITTNSWTLGPDLDPWLFVRTAETILEQGKVPAIDEMRNVPLGFDNTKETMLLPYMIVGTYKISSLFYAGTTIEFAGAIFPVIMFAFTILAFFLFVRKLFISKKEKAKANAIALIATFFMIVIPNFVSRTIAGIPEKESAAFFFMFISFYFFLKAWKNSSKKAFIFGALAGTTTAMMALIWGGVIFIYIPLALSTLVAFIFEKVNKKETLVYSEWILIAMSLSLIFSNKYNLIDFVTSIASGFAFLVFTILVMHLILENKKIKGIDFLQKIKVSKPIKTILVTLILLFIVGLLLLGPGFFIEKIKAVHQTIFQPITGRWNTTVAENRQPYFTEWGASFGPFLKNIPILFWMFIVGSILLVKNMSKSFQKINSLKLISAYTIFLFGMIFSRYSAESIFNGENFISKLLYYGSALIFLWTLMQIYSREKENLRKIDYGFMLLLSLFLLSLFSARGAIRLIMVLGPIASIFVAYLIVTILSEFNKTKEETWKTILGGILIIILLSSIFSFWTFFKITAGNPSSQTFMGSFDKTGSQAYNMIPSYYNQQWQKAMEWVREETSQEAVFAHWWDYGYWVQSIGKRATVLDGGNMIPFWNYWMGRLVLTGDNQEEALDFLYNHHATHYLIDSSDIGKYGAFSSIGSDENYDRFSWISSFLLDESQTQESKNSSTYVYSGGITLDEDLILTQNGEEIFLPSGNTGVLGIILTINSETNEIQQPYAIMTYNGNRYRVDLKYIYLDGNFLEFSEGIEATAYVYPKISYTGTGITSNPLGATMFLSPRVMRGMLAQKYILNDPFEKFPNFQLVHTEQNVVIESLNSQGMDLPEFVYYQGVQGPIKIWEIEYTGSEKVDEKYLEKDSSKYLNWKL